MSPFQLFQMVNTARNPQMMLQTMMKTNPALKQAMDYINANGGDAKDAFYKLAEEKGVDPEQILNNLR